jgi:hypothetical protein
MEKLFLTTLFFLSAFGDLFEAQTVVFNDKLFTQLTKNQAVRLASNESFFNSYEKQRKLYDEANNKLTKIVAIQDFIYSNLRNINSAIKQGKKLYYLNEKFGQIADNANQVLQLSLQRPEYAILLTSLYTGAANELLKMQEELVYEIMRESNDFLMDAYDREKVINNLMTRAGLINGYLLVIKMRLQQAKKIPYVYQIPYFKNYISLDKMIVKDIITTYKNLF